MDRLMQDPSLLIDLLNTGTPAPCATISARKANLSDLPNLPGIYVVAFTNEDCLKSLDEIYYIGVSTVSIKKRWETHHRLKFFQAIASVIERVTSKVGIVSRYIDAEPLSIFPWVNPLAEPEELLALEERLIQTIKPPFNDLTIGEGRDSELVSVLKAGNKLNIKPEAQETILQALIMYSELKKLRFD